MTEQAHMKCLSPILKQMNALCIFGIVFWLQQTRILPHFTKPPPPPNNSILAVKQERFIFIKSRVGKTRWEI